MTGKEIYTMIKMKHDLYIVSPKDNEKQPVVELTTHQCFKLLSYLDFGSRYYNSLEALSSGALDNFNFESVKITRKEDSECVN